MFDNVRNALGIVCNENFLPLSFLFFAYFPSGLETTSSRIWQRNVLMATRWTGSKGTIDYHVLIYIQALTKATPINYANN
jgi:hypothetical protein